MDPIFSYDDFSGVTYEIGGPGSWSEPVTGSGMVYAAKWEAQTSNTTLYAISLETGSEIWQKNYPSQIKRVVYDDEKIYFGSDKLYSLNATNGDEVWSQGNDFVGNNINNSYVYRVDTGVVYSWEGEFGENTFLALNSSTGVQISSLGNYDMRYVFDIVFDQYNLYLINGSSGAYTHLKAFNKNTFSHIWTSSTCLGNHANAMLDEREGAIYISSQSERFCAYSTSTGAQYFYKDFAMNSGFVKYGDRIYSFAGINSGVLNTIIPQQLNGDFFQELILNGRRFASSPVVVNGVLYGGTSDGGVWGQNLETKEYKSFNVGTSWINYIAYSDGRFILREKDDSNPKIHIRNISDLNISDQREGTIEITNPYNMTGMNQYLGQLHAHYKPDINWNSIFKTPIPTPEFTINKYMDAEYDFIALTEHNEVVPMPVVDTGILQIENAEEDTQGAGGNHILAIGIQDEIDEDLSDQERIDQVVDQAGLAILSHPNNTEYPWTMDEMIRMNGYLGIEVFNGFAYATSPISRKWGNMLDEGIYDSILSIKKTFLSASDDYTPGNPGFNQMGVEVFSEDLSQESILSNIKKGNFYAIQGSDAPRFSSIRVSGGKIWVNADANYNIKFIGKEGMLLQEAFDTNQASYEVVGDEDYVRIELWDTQVNKKSWSQPLYVEDIKNSKTDTAGSHFLELTPEAKLLLSSTMEVVSKTIVAIDLPEISPTQGYMSPVYSFETDGDVNEGTELFISYNDKNILTNEDNLSVYIYDIDLSIWTKVPSFVDKDKKTVSAKLDHFSLYTLSADQSEDTEAPSVDLVLPTTLENLDGEINLEVEATDNNVVFSTSFAIDDRLFATDTDPADGWNAILNTDDYVGGAHVLRVSAEDTSGNIAEKDYEISIINSTFTAPSVEIGSIADNDNLIGMRTISGTFESQEAVANTDLFIDDFHIDKVNASENIFSYDLNFDQITNGEHRIEIKLIDVKGNVASSYKKVYVGELSPKIITPNSSKLLYSKTFEINYYPDSNQVFAKLDRQVVKNGSVHKAYDLGIGVYKIKLFYNGEQVGKQRIEITTTIANMKKVTSLLYADGHITNQKTKSKIKSKLNIALAYKKQGLDTISRNKLIQTLKYISNRNLKDPQSIDDYGFEVLEEGLKYLINK